MELVQNGRVMQGIKLVEIHDPTARHLAKYMPTKHYKNGVRVLVGIFCLIDEKKH